MLKIIPPTIPELNDDMFAELLFQRILLKAVDRKAQVILYDGVQVNITKGQCIFHGEQWASAFGLKESEALRVWRKLKELEDVKNLITTDRTRSCTVVTVLDYQSWIDGGRLGEKPKQTNKKYIHQDFLDRFNQATGKKHRVLPDKAKRQLNARLKDGYTVDDVIAAASVCSKDDWHKRKKLKYLTPEFITRPDKFEVYFQPQEEEDNVWMVPSLMPDGKTRYIKK